MLAPLEGMCSISEVFDLTPEIDQNLMRKYTCVDLSQKSCIHTALHDLQGNKIQVVFCSVFLDVS